MYYFYRCGDRSPKGWRHLRLRSAHVYHTQFKSRARQTLDATTHYTPAHSNYWKGEAATSGHCPDGVEGGSSFRRSCLGREHKWQDWKNVGLWPLRDSKRQRPSRCSLCLSSLWWVEPRQKGFEIQRLWCHPCDQVTTSVLCKRYSQLSNLSPCTASQPFPTQVISSLTLASL